MMAVDEGMRWYVGDAAATAGFKSGPAAAQAARDAAVGSSIKALARTVAADFSITTADMEFTITATAACTATPSAAATLGNGFECEIHADGGAVTIGSATVADGSVARLTVRNGKLCIVQGAWAEVTLS